jgi:dUTP pyrophosphatase
LANSIGIIDAGYRGNIKAKVRNFNQSEQVFPLGSYFQIVAPDLKPIMVNIVQEQSETTRNDGGFGSTNN